MADVGEDLVGAYLRYVQNCEVVSFNVRTGIGQGEIDVVGLVLDGGVITHAHLCEVSTHTSGLGGYRGDPVGKLGAKLRAVAEYADRVLPGVDRTVEFWSPVVSPKLAGQLETLAAKEAGLTVVINDEYANRVRALAGQARATKAFSDQTTFRLLQILTRVKLIN